MSIRATERIESVYSNIESPPSDLELKTKEAKSINNLLFIFISIDYILSVLIIINECNIFKNKENDFIMLLIKVISLTLFYSLIIISLILLKQKLAKVLRYIYLAFAILYFLFELFLNVIIYMKEIPDNYWFDILFFILILITMIPRILFFYYFGLLIRKIIEIDDCKKGEEHDKFRQNLENRMERGDTNWSKTSLPSEKRHQSQFLKGSTGSKFNKSTNNNNSNIVYSIKENYIEEEQDNGNNNNENNNENNNDNEN